MGAELLVEGGLCMPVPSRQISESDFESELFGHRNHLFPGWLVCGFKTDVEAFSTPHGKKRADIALIDPNFQSWWVVEVELAHHSVERHVAPQIEVLALGEYQQRHAKLLCRKLDLDSTESLLLSNLLANRQPRVLIVVNNFVPSWKPLVQDFARIMVVRPFENRLGKRSFLIDGDRPDKGTAYISSCIREPAMPGSLVVSNPHRIPFSSGQRLQLLVDNGWTNWTYYLLGANAFLFASGTFPLGNDREFILGHDAAGRLFLKPLTSAIRRHLK